MRRRHRTLLRLAVVLVGASVLGPAGSAGATGCKNQELQPTRHNVKQIRSAVRCLVNSERKDRGLRALASRRSLRKAAQRHSKSMVRRHYFNHIGPGGSTPKRRMRKAGYSGKAFGENITYGTGHHATPLSAVGRWMASSAHRRVILRGAYDHLGVGVALGNPHDRSGATFTTTFGAR